MSERITVYHGGVATIPKTKIKEAAEKLARYEDLEDTKKPKKIQKLFQINLLYDGYYKSFEIPAKEDKEALSILYTKIDTAKEYEIISVNKTPPGVTLLTYLRKNGLKIDCSGGLGRFVNVDIEFYNPYNGFLDETEFSVSSIVASGNYEELNELFTEFCKENDFQRNIVRDVYIVEAADTMQELS